MIGPRNSREEDAYRRTVYPGTTVYLNKLDVRDTGSIQKIERYLSSTRAKQDFPARAHCRSCTGFKAIHRHLFQDLYAWAGQERCYTTGRGPAPFALPEHISNWMSQQFAALAADRYLVGLSLAEFAVAAARYVNEINAAHPFIDGNGRTQRFWLRMLAENAGVELRLSERDRKVWNDASRLGFTQADHAPMAALLRRRLTSPCQ